MTDVQKNRLCLIKLEESFLGRVIDFIPEIFGSLFDFAHLMALMGVEHQARGTNHAGYFEEYQ